ncbi:PQQ-dependent sugar dehydrogenase [Flavobacterium johnsoniae]|uniref:Glucose/sorbosone dehydrogenase-like protein n=1 Tax=Flavobacterium johnsoniae (strain ATCC 17061 / DSM 2064 / JCM 8514 / BCRC 14874 / CCUG 350202 / NBRC 14942 / NCIMB 11054 / UW101) TaxID=376686 RepID=A5FMV9_FLAJ1|nr:sorbosone dehydrogenase family protein [Flavobacterium johnsoniae]ABQ03458.1 Glucose/sorbosone dehydrogenase-like protein [Flavobacterium johnsoniae UW101]OXG01127.1 L-sorbosone dehydrogenase [Flavobacterium johnsoniae UW101]WQG79678.1 sorbosone dehydrogenase family protein [Flavobacterium johnsoniae UW101]SHL74562.1 Glucose/arabinose dehydrogenase, beta-propeller fold [Flavobacterium johnsoniae]
MKKSLTLFSIPLLALMTACNGQVKKEEKEALAKQLGNVVKTAVGDITLPPPYATESKTNNSKVIGWPKDKTPKAPEGFTVTKFADGFENPRWTYIAPNQDIFVVESGTRTSKNQITVLRDKDKDGKFETREVFISGLNKPFGMLVLKDFFYIANTDGLYRYPYKNNPLKLETKGEKILELPAGGYNNHWTRNLLASPDGSKIYVSVGSGSNNAEHGVDKEVRRAGILEINPDGTGEKIYASGLRNPVGMDWNPVNKELWTAVNERDELGDDLVPDYITSVKRDGFYGWPYSYFGSIPDPRMKGERKDLVEKAIVPDVPVGAHTASLGLAFYTKDAFPAKYKNGVFVGQHGSWNRSKISGYKVLFVPFKDGKPSEKPEDFLTGFISDENKAEVYGRPVAVTVMNDGSLLVNDDSSNTIWKVTAK